MATIELTPTSLIVHVTGADTFWALKSRLEVPLEHVVGAELDPEVQEKWTDLWKGVRLPGTHIPGVIAAGSLYHHQEWVFWDVHHPEKTVTIRLAHEHYSKLVIEVDDPAAAVAAIQQAIRTRPA